MKKTEDVAIKKVKKWLERDGNSVKKLAEAMDYSTPMTIHHWLYNGRVPSHQLPRVIKYIGGRK